MLVFITVFMEIKHRQKAVKVVESVKFNTPRSKLPKLQEVPFQFYFFYSSATLE